MYISSYPFPRILLASSTTHRLFPGKITANLVYFSRVSDGTGEPVLRIEQESPNRVRHRRRRRSAAAAASSAGRGGPSPPARPSSRHTRPVTQGRSSLAAFLTSLGTPQATVDIFVTDLSGNVVKRISNTGTHLVLATHLDLVRVTEVLTARPMCSIRRPELCVPCPRTWQERILVVVGP